MIYLDQRLGVALAQLGRTSLKVKTAWLKTARPNIVIAQMTQQCLTNIFRFANEQLVIKIVQPVDAGCRWRMSADRFPRKTIVFPVWLPSHADSSPLLDMDIQASVWVTWHYHLDFVHHEDHEGHEGFGYL
ncbi:MAG: hypothetical protein HW419_684 [Deltaproteobacteria bacterium]|nr:hypothetical protein [Deltaproteobacteria bacterium]